MGLRGIDTAPGAPAPLSAIGTVARLRAPAMVKRSLDNRSSALKLKHMLNHYPQLDRIFHALADPSRRAMIERLGAGAASVSELAQPLAMSLAAVVQHLQVLEGSGLVRSSKTGRVRTCELDRDGLSAAERWIGQRREAGERQLDRLGAYLAAHAAAPPADPKPHPRKRRPA